MAEPVTAEFDCCECGVHVYAICVDKAPDPPLCCTCLHVPGWMHDPRLREIFGHGILGPRPGRTP